MSHCIFLLHELLEASAFSRYSQYVLSPKEKAQAGQDGDDADMLVDNDAIIDANSEGEQEGDASLPSVAARAASQRKTYYELPAWRIVLVRVVSVFWEWWS